MYRFPSLNSLALYHARNTIRKVNGQGLGLVSPVVFIFSSGSLLLGADFFKRFYLFISRERGREGEREGEKHQYVVASRTPLLGTWPAIQACALTGN